MSNMPLKTELNEEDGMDILVSIVQLARAGKPYKKELKELDAYARKFPKVSSLVQDLYRNLEK